MIKNEKLKKILKPAAVLTVAAGVTVGATFAFLTAQTDKVKNTFTPSGDIKIELKEPHFEQTGEASHFAPGSVIPKDPTVDIPIDSSQNEYVASTISYYADKNGDGVYSDDEKVSYSDFVNTYAHVYFLNGAEVSDKSLAFNNEWTTTDDFVYYYTNSSDVADLKVMNKGEKSVIFDKVIVNKDIPTYTSDTSKYTKGTPVAFKIDVKAYGVQDSVDKATAKKALDLMIEGKDPNSVL